MAAKKIAILGGGIAGLSTALELTATPALRQQHQIVIYQMGWRLGGKCASGRDPGGRVLEHGIHLFGGGYYNTLPMMEEVYAELQATGGWHSSFDQSFEKQYVSVRIDAAAVPPVDVSDLPPNRRLPADGRRAQSPRDWMLLLARNLRDWLLTRAAAPGNLANELLGGVSAVAGLALSPLQAAGPQLDRLLLQIETDAKAALATVEGMQQLVRGMEIASASLSVDKLLSGKGSLITANYLLALLRGALLDLEVLGLSFNELDGKYNYDAWLDRHGAWPETIKSAVALSPLRILYQSPHGDPNEKFLMGGGAYLHWSLRQLAYLGAPFWFFTCGTGDSVVMPIYELLRRRGVGFEFFQRVEALHLDNQATRLDSIEMRVQATLRDPSKPYLPEVHFGGKACWPDRPLYGQLNEEAALRALPPDELENYWSDWRAPGRPNRFLRAGVDFDVAVFAISLGAVPLLCKQLLAASGAWESMVANIPTVETQSLQIWMSSSSLALGSPVRSPKDPDDTGLGCGFATPFDGFSDFSLLIEHEHWPIATKPESLWYFSDVLVQEGASLPDPADAGYPQRRHRDAVANSIAFLDAHLGTLMPGVVKGGAFNYTGLLVPQPPAAAPTPADCLATQWVRANVQPSDRYVQAPAGSTHARLEAGDAKFGGLVLAGDWTYTGLNVGCVEAAVMSGRLASNAICGLPLKSQIAGYFPP